MSFEHVDPLLVKAKGSKRDAEKDYEDQAQPRRACPQWLEPAPDLLQADWVAIRVEFTLERPWYSRDDVPFHVLHNPVRRERAFDRPFMAASSWKGLLRWACRMERGLFDDFDSDTLTLKDRKDDPIIEHLFGPAPSSSSTEAHRGEWEGRRGALAFRPTWFERADDGPLIGFELINPHDRARKKGKNPITYEVVAAGSKGSLELLYAPSPGAMKSDEVSSRDVIHLLVDAVGSLLERYGISAKRTAGWGRSKIDCVQLRRRDADVLEGCACHDEGVIGHVKVQLPSWLDEEHV